MSQTSLKQKVGLHIDIIMPWDYSTIYWNFSVAFFVHTAHGCLIQMCHQNYSKLSGTFFAGEILILYRANSRFRVPPGSNLNLSLMTVLSTGTWPVSPTSAQSFNFPRWLRRHEMTAAQSPATRTGMEQFHGIQPYAARPGPAATRRRCSVVMVGFSRGWSVVKLVTSRPFQRVIYRGHCSRSCGVRGSGWVRTYFITTSSKPFVLSHFIHLIKDCCV